MGCRSSGQGSVSEAQADGRDPGQVQNSRATAPALQPVAAHELTANKKRKPAARKSTNQSN